MDSQTDEKITVQIYDCKKSKIIKKHTIKKSKYEGKGVSLITKKYSYCPVYSGEVTRLYRCAMNRKCK